MSAIRFSILIPVKEVNHYVRETVPYIQKLYTNNWELFILTNNTEPNEWSDPRIKIAPTGCVGPGAKRDFGATLAKGDILVFLDDDSYPEPTLLKIAEEDFEDQRIVALGGPAVTPHRCGFWERVSGAVYLSRWSGGAPERYIPLGKKKYVDDWPSVNMMVRKAAFHNIGGFDTEYWPGEDTKLCLKLVASEHGGILYDPALVVWHHRRKDLLSHLKQVGAYGLHRGFFAKEYPETSLRAKYFAPSAFASYLIFLNLSYGINGSLEPILMIPGCFYLFAMTMAIHTVFRLESLLVSIAVIPYIFLTHLAYGVMFIKGLMTKKLTSRLR
jgi:cellulose synthase/poly-beta-1,6-N-acetylglucosamine synthase-like glycosyltransferase